MTTRGNYARNFASFSLSLDRARAIVQERRHARETHNLGKLYVTVTFEGSHVQGLILTLAKASKKEVT